MVAGTGTGGLRRRGLMVDMTDLASVAARAGVSLATASRVLSGNGPASPGSRERVLSAAAELGYRPHPVARLLAQGRGTRVVLAIRDRRPSARDDPFGGRAAAGAALAADRAGLGVALRYLPLDCAGRLAEIAADRSVAALVLAGHDRATLRALPRGLRVATIGPSPGAGADVDSGAGFTALLWHLYDRGRRRIALVGGPRWFAAAGAPLRAYARMTREAGLPHRAVTGDVTAARGRLGARRVLSRWPDTDAIVTISDATAVGVLQALAERGIRVPDDVAVTGFDDVPLAGAIRPGLTTASHPVEEIAEAACQAALDGGGMRLFPSRAVVRQTT
jgi:DNA-binding LacI/PurR family transcriptional regulator